MTHDIMSADYSALHPADALEAITLLRSAVNDKDEYIATLLTQVSNRETIIRNQTRLAEAGESVLQDYLRDGDIDADVAKAIANAAGWSIAVTRDIEIVVTFKATISCEPDNDDWDSNWSWNASLDAPYGIEILSEDCDIQEIRDAD